MSTTVDAADYDYDYISALTDTSGNTVVYLSDVPIHVLTSNRTSTLEGPYIYYIGYATTNNVLALVYNTALSQWQTETILTPGEYTSNLYIFGTSTQASRGSLVSIKGGMYGSSIDQIYSIITNSSLNTLEQSVFTGYSTDLTQLPQGLTEDAIRDIIDEQLNTSSASGQAAQTIINNTTTNYNLYLTGDIDSGTMQSYVTDNLDALSELSPSTLLDAMQINNALVYNQSIQEKLLLTASEGILDLIGTYRNATNTEVNRYRHGELDQREVVSRIRSYIRDFNNLVIENGFTSQADLQAAQACISMMQSQLDSVTGFSDLSQDSSDKSQASDQAELDYLDELQSETTATIEQIAPSQNFTSTQTGEAQEVLNLIWENEFVKRLLPMCAGFMVVCVVLGIKYKV